MTRSSVADPTTRGEPGHPDPPDEARERCHHHDDGRHLRMQVELAVRLGWYLAEVRGRTWWKGQRPVADGLPADPGRALPLRPQRTLVESRRQAVEALVYLSEKLKVTAPPTIGGDAPSTPFESQLATLMTALEADDCALLDPRVSAGASTADRDRAWNEVAALIYDWDAAIQDELTARDDILACGYLLGRGLAEIYWALAPRSEQTSSDRATPSAGSWRYLLHPDRRHELSRMVGRIAAYLHPLTPVAVSGSLEAWGCVVDDPDWCGREDAPTHLYEQLRRWYQLLILGQDPTTLVKASAMLRRNRRTTLRLARAFWPQLVVGTLSVAAAAALVLLLSTDRGNPALKSLLAIAAAIGLSASTVTAKAKSATQSLFARLRQSAYSDLVAIEVSAVPPHPGDDRKHGSRGNSEGARIVERAVTARSLAMATAVTDTPLRM